MTRRQRTRVVLGTALGLAISLPLIISAAVMATPPPPVDPTPVEMVLRHLQKTEAPPQRLYETLVTNDKAVVNSVRAAPDAVETTRYELLRRGSTWTAPRVIERSASPRRADDE